jgi:hypothetical protein
MAPVDRNEGGYTICDNDGIILFSTAEQDWAKGGVLEDSVVAMFWPVDRQ